MATTNLLLFDIDGTLLHARGAGRRAMEAALRKVLGLSGALGFSFGGMTDVQIVRTALEGTVHSHEINWVLDEYLAFLEAEIEAGASMVVYQGVRELLAALANQKNVILGLGTGNLEKGAFLKLKTAGLDGWFRFGGFGSDHENRQEVLRIGVERGLQITQLNRDEVRVIVIGDTVRDIEAAKGIDAECLAVSHGMVSIEVLRENGADWVFQGLADSGVFELLSQSRLFCLLL